MTTHPKPAAVLLAGLLLTCATLANAQVVGLRVTIENRAPANGTWLTPTWVGFHSGSFDTHDLLSAASTELERLAEDGNSDPLASLFDLNAPTGTQGSVAGAIGPIAPGESASLSVIVDPDAGARYFSYASMVIPSNDAFVGNADPVAYAVFDSLGQFLGADFIIAGGDVRDAGTEVNDEVPAHTAFFGQTTPNTGVDEFSVVHDHPGYLPPGSGGILDDPMFANADFTQTGYEVARVTVERAETVVPAGLVSGTWTVADGPYLIRGDIAVAPGQSLTIQPGVLVAFDGPWRFLVEGTLSAVGTADDPVRFTLTPTNDGWGGIRFTNAGPQNELRHCVIEYGTPTGPDPFNLGGAIFMDNSSPTIADCTIRFNTAAEGGAIFCRNGSAPVLERNQIVDNLVSSGFLARGGGLAARDSNVMLNDNFIARNQALVTSINTATAYGGGVYVHDCTTTLSGNIFADNHIEANGDPSSRRAEGSAYFAGESDSTLIGNTFSGNTGMLYSFESDGGTVHISGGGSTAALVNTIVHDSVGYGVFAEEFTSVEVRYCDFFANSRGAGGGPNLPTGFGQISGQNANGDPADTHSNIFLDPMFVDAAADDYHLQPGSPCIDAGDPTTPADPDGTTPDIGALFFDQGTAAPGDLNCDGAVNAGDIDPFVLALTDPAAYVTAFPNCDINRADINADGDVNAGDIDPFVALLVGR